jgi:hypothetical protein
MSRQADRRAHLDLQISLLAEHCIPCDGSPPRFREAKPPAFYKRSQKADSSAAPHNAILTQSKMTRTGHEPTLADTGVSSPRFFPLTRHPAHAGIQVVSAPISLDIRSRLYDGNAVVSPGPSIVPHATVHRRTVFTGVIYLSYRNLRLSCSGQSP